MAFKNIVVGCVYCHPRMDANDCNEHYLSILNEKHLLEKNKEIILMGDFNINLLRYNKDHNSTDFLDQTYSCSLIRCITSPTCLTPQSKTLIDNIFSTDAANEVIAGNILTTSDHLAQFLLFLIKRTKPESKANNYCRNFKRFDPKVFLQDLKNINWHTALKLDKENLDNSFDRFFQIIETLLDTYAPIEKLSRKKQKLMLKPWLMKGIMTSVKKKNIIYRKFIRARHDEEKAVIYNQFKTYQNIINSLKLANEIIIRNIFMNTKRIYMLKTGDRIKSIININKNE